MGTKAFPNPSDLQENVRYQALISKHFSSCLGFMKYEHREEK